MDSIGENIRKLRASKKITLATAASALNIKENILAKIENGKEKASLSEIERIEGFIKKLSSKDYEIKSNGEEKNLNLGENAVVYGKIALATKHENAIEIIHSFLKTDNRISDAFYIWILCLWRRKIILGIFLALLENLLFMYIIA